MTLQERVDCQLAETALLTSMFSYIFYRMVTGPTAWTAFVIIVFLHMSWKAVQGYNELALIIEGYEEDCYD